MMYNVSRSISKGGVLYFVTLVVFG